MRFATFPSEGHEQLLTACTPNVASPATATCRRAEPAEVTAIRSPGNNMPSRKRPHRNCTWQLIHRGFTLSIAYFQMSPRACCKRAVRVVRMALTHGLGGRQRGSSAFCYLPGAPPADGNREQPKTQSALREHHARAKSMLTYGNKRKLTC